MPEIFYDQGLTLHLTDAQYARLIEVRNEGMDHHVCPICGKEFYSREDKHPMHVVRGCLLRRPPVRGIRIPCSKECSREHRRIIEMVKESKP